MKIHIVEKTEEAIENYQPVLLQNGVVDFFGISDSECTEIRAPNVVDQFTFGAEGVQRGLANIAKKLRMGGRLYISGVDTNVLARGVLNQTVSEETFSQIVERNRSMSSLKTIAKMLSSFGLDVVEAKVVPSSFSYEIICQRGSNG